MLWLGGNKRSLEGLLLKAPFCFVDYSRGVWTVDIVLMSRLLLSHQFRLREMGMSSDSSLGGQRENGKMVYLFICVHVHAGSHGHDFAVAPNNIKWAKNS